MRGSCMAERINEKVRREVLEPARIDERARKEEPVRRLRGQVADPAARRRDLRQRDDREGISIHTTSREVYSSDGSSRVVHSADASSPSFGQDLEHIFRLNVARARRDNKRIVGVADLAPRKR